LNVILEHVRVDDNGDVVALGWARSDSNPELLYGVYVRIRGGRVVKSMCTCKGYVYRGYCKHVMRLVAAARQYMSAAYNQPSPQAAKPPH
jgi:hypothetical protein